MFPVGSARFSGGGAFDGKRLELAGEGTMTLAGNVDVEVHGKGKLTLIIEGIASATIRTFVSDELEVVYFGTVDTVRIVHDVQLAPGATYRERIAAGVHGLFDASTTVTHEGRANSDLLTKVAVAEGGKAIVRGKIVVRKGAEGSRGTERIDALLLGQKAEADVLPMLVVDTDDVACKHAASVGHMDENVLFYLASRGIDPIAARQVLTEAFLQF